MKKKKSFASIVLLCAVTAVLTLNGCGVDKTTSSSTTLAGVASLDSAISGTVSVKGSSALSQEKKASISSNGSYSVNVAGLTPPYIIKAEGTGQAGDTQVLYSMSKNGGRVNINRISDTAVAASADANATDASALYVTRFSEDTHHQTTDNYYTIINKLRTVLAPLFTLYQVSGNGANDDDHVSDHDYSGLRAMLHDVRFVIASGTVTVTNRLTGSLIYSAPLKNLTSGTFYPENMPAGPGGSTTCTSFTYSGWGTCQADNTQTRTVATSSPSGCTGGTPVLSQACTYVPPTSTCSYNYSTWGACQSNNTQTRTVTSSSPAGCAGTPVLSQACIYVPPATTCTSFTYSAWGACQSNNTQTRTVSTSSPSGCTGGTPVLSQTCTYVPPVTACTSFTYSAWGTCQSNNTQTRTVATSSPAGCTGGTPVLSQACTYVPPTCTSFTYSGWGTCQSNNTQTRTVATSSPAGCTGGTPVLSQACTYVPPTCTSFTYSAWGTCQSNNTQTRTVSTSSPSGCTGGTPVLSQACTYVPPTPVCGSCHAIPPSTGQHSYHVSTQGFGCSTCHGAGYSATAVTAATHMDGSLTLVSSLNYNATASSCSPGCHGTRTW